MWITSIEGKLSLDLKQFLHPLQNFNSGVHSITLYFFRFANLERLAGRRKNQLDAKLKLLLFHRSVDECMEWIEEKKDPLLEGI